MFLFCLAFYINHVILFMIVIGWCSLEDYFFSYDSFLSFAFFLLLFNYFLFCYHYYFLSIVITKKNKVLLDLNNIFDMIHFLFNSTDLDYCCYLFSIIYDYLFSSMIMFLIFINTLKKFLTFFC